VGKSPREPLWACKVHIAAEFRDWLKKRFPFVHIILVPAGCTGVAQRGVRREQWIGEGGSEERDGEADGDDT